MKKQQGFSLIELLIVVVIIGIIAAIAIPNLLAARRSANEGSAVSSLRTVHGAQMTYHTTTGQGNFGTLQALYATNLIDSQLGAATPQKSGYLFALAKTDKASGSAATFGLKGDPVTVGGVSATGTRAFAIGTEGVIYTATAATTSPFTVSATQTNGNNIVGTSTALNN